MIEPEDLPNGIENTPESRKSGQSSGKEKKMEKSTSTPGKIRKGSEGSTKSRKSSESNIKSPGKSKSAPELLETPQKARKDSSKSLASPKSPKKLPTPKPKKNSNSETLSSPRSKTPSKELENGDDDVIMIIDDSNTSIGSNFKSPKSKNAEFWPNPKAYKYAVQLYHEKESKKNEAKEVIMVDSEHIR